MRTLQEIEKDLCKARSDLSCVEGNRAEVYSRIVGYYRAVCNWNKGKREEYGERKLYNVERSLEKAEAGASGTPVTAESNDALQAKKGAVVDFKKAIEFGQESKGGNKLLLFVRPNCPQCPSAKNAAAKLRLPVDIVNADTEEGLTLAAKFNVMATPTAILVSSGGKELARARDAASISRLNINMEQPLEVIRKSA